MSFSEIDEDLLRPSLSSKDDLGEFDRPWYPPHITLIGFLCGLVTAGILFGWNYRRLGIQRRQWWIVLGALLLFLAFQCGVTYGLSVGWWGLNDAPTIRFVNRGLTIVASLLIAHDQKSRYRLAMATDHPAGSIWIPGFIAMGIGVICNVAFAELVVPLFFAE